MTSYRWSFHSCNYLDYLPTDIFTCFLPIYIYEGICDFMHNFQNLLFIYRNSQIGNFPHEDDDIYEMEEMDCTYTPNSNNHFYHHQNFNHNNIVNSNSNNCKHHDSTKKRNAWINHKQANNFSSSSTASSTIMNMERDYQNKR